MKFARISQRGVLDAFLVLILVAQGGVQLISNCLEVLNMHAMRLRVGHGVEAVRVA
jgi:hypothetical protein